MTQLVLSLFPGIGLLDRGFEDEGFTVVRGPDLLWGGDVKKFHVPAGRFDGVIGGPPCQAFSTLRHLVLATGKKLADNLIPEYERICREASPHWFVMENVPAAPEPVVGGYLVKSILLNNRWCPAEPDGSVGAEQNRERRFSFGTAEGLSLMPRVALWESPRKALAVMANGGGVTFPSRSEEAANGNGGCFNVDPTTILEPVPSTVISNPGRSFTTSHPDGEGGRRKNGRARRGPTLKAQDLATVETVTANGTAWNPKLQRAEAHRTEAYFRRACELQGLPEDFDLPPFTVSAKIKAVGNGVPYAMARVIARAVREAVSSVALATSDSGAHGLSDSNDPGKKRDP